MSGIHGRTPLQGSASTGAAAAVAANFGAAGLGTDTGNSIRGPSSHQALVGIRSLDPAGAAAWPLVVSDRLIGTLAGSAVATAYAHVCGGSDWLLGLGMAASAGMA